VSRSSLDEEDLRLNTLHRFAKHSPRLTLQEYSHCEVPAGCGGAVLRWVDPRRGIPVRVRVIVLGEAETWLDGKQLPGGYTRIESGAHVIALHVTKLGRAAWEHNASSVPRPVPLIVSVFADGGPNQGGGGIADDLLERARRVERRWTSVKPAPEFAATGFDDRTWRVLGPAAEDLLEPLPAHTRRTLERMRRDGTSMFTLGDPAEPTLEEAWVRIAFTLDASAEVDRA
jgi:hypothetical protein